MDSSRIIPRQKRAFSIQQSTSVNILEDEAIVKEEEENYTEDVLEIKGSEQQTTETEFVDELEEQSEEQHKLFYTYKKAGKYHRLTPGIKYEDRQLLG